jgi:hypothetical protein
MEAVKAIPFTRYLCCRKDSCMKFETMWEAGACYDDGGRLTRDCSDCKR